MDVRRITGALRRRLRDASYLVRSRGRRRGARRGPGDTLLLTGWYGTETVGDQAILAGLLSVIRDLHQGPITVASLDPEVTVETLREIDADHRVAVCSYPDARRLIDKVGIRAVAMAGGPVMGTIDPLLDLADLHLAARRRGIPDGFLGCGVGPVGRSLRARVIGALLRGATEVTVRDRDSAAIVLALARRRVEVSGDPALIWLATHGSAPPRPNGKTLGLALRRWPLHEFALGRATATHRRHLEDELAQFAEDAHLAGWALEPIAMGFLAIGGDDRAFLEQVLPSGSVSYDLAGAATSPRRVVQQMHGCNVVVAMRFHACLFALSMGVPVVAIDYTLGGKIAALRHQFGDHLQILDPRSLDAAALAAAVEAATEDGSAAPKPDAGHARRILAGSLQRLLASGGSVAEHRIAQP